MNFVFFIHNKKDYNENIVQSIIFYDKLSIGNLVYKNRSRDKCLLEEVESIITRGIKLPENVLSDKAY